MSEEERIDPTTLTLTQKIYMVQQEMPVMTKDAEGFNYNYFEINSLLKVLKPLLRKYGLLVMQPLVHLEGKPALRTQVISGDEEMHWDTPLPGRLVDGGGSKMTVPQQCGSIITYYRRYALASLFLLESEDNDGT